jgi:hypothetical protein
MPEAYENQGETSVGRQYPARLHGGSNDVHISQHECGQCEEYHAESYYCNLCDMTYCKRCWNKIGPHRTGKTGPGGIPHEKTDQTVADKLRMTLEATPNESEQDELFQKDENTAWFGVARDEFEDSIFMITDGMETLQQKFLSLQDYVNEMPAIFLA